jgi:hypothetical protein
VIEVDRRGEGVIVIRIRRRSLISKRKKKVEKSIPKNIENIENII